MKMLFKVTREKTETLLNGVDFELENFGIKFKDGTRIKLMELDDAIVRNGEYVMYTNNTITLKYARRIIEALYK